MREPIDIQNIMRKPGLFIATLGFYIGGTLIVKPDLFNRLNLSSRETGLVIFGISILVMVSGYLGIFRNLDYRAQGTSTTNSAADREMKTLLREVRNYLVHGSSSGTNSPVQVNIDDEFKGQVVARLVTESQAALQAFIESEVFGNDAEKRHKQSEHERLLGSVEALLKTYQVDMRVWNRNANVNLVIGLACAISGIVVMWQTLGTLNVLPALDNIWRISDLYRMLSRVGLVILIESVSFFFLKLYREDRSMIRYMRNEITNLEARTLALRTALAFGTAADLTKILVSLTGTERNFLIKKGDRVITDLGYENSEILIEKLLSRPEFISRLKAAASANLEA